jgi:hypothetical protein
VAPYSVEMSWVATVLSQDSTASSTIIFVSPLALLLPRFELPSTHFSPHQQPSFVFWRLSLLI